MQLDGNKLNLLFESFSDITSLARAGRGIEQVYTCVLDCCHSLLHPARVELLLIRGDDLLRHTRDQRPGEVALQSERAGGSDALLEWLQIDGSPFVGTVEECSRRLPESILAPSGTVAWMPLVTQENAIGVLIGVRESSEPCFDPGDLHLLTLLANQTAIALENLSLYEQLQREAVTDGLTGIHNYRALMGALRLELRRARRHEQVFSFVMADVDHLKTYNERFGHIAGSQVLAQVARLLVNNCRATDTVGKYGGDEFALILPQTGPEGAREVSDRMRRAIERHAFKHVRAGDVTCTFGVAAYPIDATDVRELIRQADRILFKAKRAGKNRVLTTEDLEPSTEARQASQPAIAPLPRVEPEPSHS